MFTAINAANAYSTARNAVAPGSSEGVVDKVSDAASGFAQQMSQVDSVATGAMTGKVETHQLVQTIAEAELAMETVVAIRDKVVEAYQEILRMPV
ncbi:flagellar hook-basal body complex protein FliE [Paracoccus fistulariae]|uniref:Flagellar hook-basal body complex protein FliE n=1 Tax=Paracoccus fistulariae TaxID=658446 RepID=A0ABY7SI31_9RHOB|nr:flagellar hook-basal body complex protein FliE [Paracoccus fistulariae]MDB6181176.1 flagellar hook-basal body complex protein FliE [Paracoccus fistulariae]WCR06461.1 flagellar hook-basal body complex protein FliE [Paracoccus fistulariae]